MLSDLLSVATTVYSGLSIIKSAAEELTPEDSGWCKMFYDTLLILSTTFCVTRSKLSFDYINEDREFRIDD